MPRSKMNADHVSELVSEMSSSSIFKHIPLKTIGMELQKLDLKSQRNRRLPAESIIYLLIIMALHAEVSIIENLRIMLYPISKLLGAKNSKVPVGSAIVKARRRLGKKVFRNIFAEICKPCARQVTKGCFWKGYRMVAVDGTAQNVQDTEENRNYFGVHSSNQIKSSYPQLKAVALMECGTKVFFDVKTGKYNTSEQALFRDMLDSLTKDMVLFADRAYFSLDSWVNSANKAGALIWRIKKDLKLKETERLSDGSYVSELKPTRQQIKKWPHLSEIDLIKVRVIEFKPVFEDDSKGETVRLITTILDIKKASAIEIAKAYPNRWLIEDGFSELKHHLGKKEKVLRSQTPDFVIQEFYGFLLAHYVTRVIMCQSAEQNNLEPNDFSFLNSLQIIRRRIAFFPSRQ